MSNVELAQRSQELDFYREHDAIASVDFAVDTVRLWAELHDTHQTEADNSNTLNSEVVESMLADSKRKSIAFRTGYTGGNYFVINATTVAGATRDHARKVFGSDVLRSKNQKGTGTYIKLGLLDEALEAGSSHDPEGYTDFAKEVIAAHEVYRYLDNRINKGFKTHLKGTESRIKPGMEEAYWGSRIFGSKGAPGIYQIKGTLSRLMESITEFSANEYGEEADDYLAAWWASLNMIKREDSFRQTTYPIFDALVHRNLGEAQYALKEHLFNDPGLLPYRSRAKFELDDDETAYFAELRDEDEAPAKLNESEQLVILDERREMLSNALGYIGAAIMIDSKPAIVQGVRVIPKMAREVSRDPAQREATINAIPWGLIIRECNFRGGRLSTYGGSVRLMPIEKLSSNEQQGAITLLDLDEKYLDKDVRSFPIPEQAEKYL